MTSFRKLMAANRGEIAIRIFRSAHELGIRTVAIYSHEDRFASAPLKADEAYEVGKPGEPIRSYLNIDAIVELAKAKEVDAIHPGYGFLSENAEFARACAGRASRSSGRGPSSSTCWATRWRRASWPREAGVPVLSGSDAPVVPGKEAQAIAESLGYPVIVKASMGGGGRGMRVVESADALDAALDQARREAGTAFGVPDVFIEKFIQKAKHIEVQLLGDRHGNLVHLLRTRLLGSAPAPEDRRDRAGPQPRPDSPLGRSSTPPSQLGRHVAVRERRHGRVPGRCRDRRVLLHRGQSAHPGRAHGHRDRHRRRPGQEPDPDRPGQAALRPGDRPAHAGVGAGAGLCLPVPGDHRGPREQVHARLRPDHPLSLGRRPGHPDRRRTGDHRRDHHAVLRLAAGQDLRLRPPVHRRGPADGASPPGVPGARGQDQHPVPAQRARPSRVPRRRMHDAVHRRDSRALPFPDPAEPGDAALDLRRRDHGQRLSGRRAAGRTTRPTPEPEPPRFDSLSAPPPGFAPAVPGDGRRRVFALGPRAEAAARDRHDVSRRPPVAPGHARPHPRHAARRRRLRPALPGRLLDRDVGRRHLRHGHAVPQGRPLGTPGPASREDPQHPVPDAACAGRTPSATRAIPTTSSRRSSTRRPPPASTCSASSTRSTGSPTWSCRSRPSARPGLSARPPSATPATSSIPNGTKYDLTYYVGPGQGAGEARRQPDRDQGHGRPVQADGRRTADQGPARRGRRADPLPHPRHRRRAGGQRSARCRRRPRHRRRRRRLDGRPDLAAQLERDRRVAPVHPARHGRRSRGPDRDEPVLGRGPRPVRSVRVGPALARGRSLRARDARRPVHQSVSAGQGARPGRALARGLQGVYARSISSSATSSR